MADNERINFGLDPGPDVINNCVVRAKVSIPDSPGQRKGVRLLLLDRGLHVNHRYVVCLHCAGDKEWLSGHYSMTYGAALEEFAEQTKRYGRSL